MGFVGPLDREKLTFAWKVTAVRTTLRDLLETIMTSMFLNGEVERERSDWAELSQKYVCLMGAIDYSDLLYRLPFIDDHGSGLGIAVKTYLDAFEDDQEITEALKKTIKQQEGKYNWFHQLKSGGGLTKSLDQAWKIWDAVS